MTSLSLAPSRLHALVFVLATLTSGCGLVEFDVEQAIPEQTVPGSPLGALLPGGLFQFPLSIDIEASTKARGTGPASAAFLKSVTLEVTAPAGATFEFLDSLSINIVAEGLTAREVARLAPVPKQGRIELGIVEGVDLLPYIKKGATMSATAGGHMPTRDVKFVGKVVVKLKV